MFGDVMRVPKQWRHDGSRRRFDGFPTNVEPRGAEEANAPLRIPGNFAQFVRTVHKKDALQYTTSRQKNWKN